MSGAPVDPAPGPGAAAFPAIMAMTSASQDQPGKSGLEPEPQDNGLAPLFADVRRLAAEARTAAEAEAAYQTSRAKVVAGSVGRIAALGALALALVFFALMALVMGGLLVLAPLVGPLAATGIVTGLLAACAAICALLARYKVKRMMALAFPAKEKA